MDARGRTFLLLQIFFCFFVFASTEETKQNCSQVQCPGPLIFYHDMGCTPVYRNQGDCCAYKYNCDHIYARSPNKCYIQNRSYEIGEYVNQKDIGLCGITCLCVAAEFSSRFRCWYRGYDYSCPTGAICYVKRKIHECGPGTLTSAKSESDIPRCVVDGHEYKVGQLFAPKNEPWKLCMCQKDYTDIHSGLLKIWNYIVSPFYMFAESSYSDSSGDNNEQFCTTPNTRCTPEFYLNDEIARKNAPIIESEEQTFRTLLLPPTCTVSWRRYNEADFVISNATGPTASEGTSSFGEDLTCKFGNLTMNIGDELSRYGDYPKRCIRCICEVPPTPTCKIDYCNCY